jgi:uncharacterized protein YcbX
MADITQAQVGSLVSLWRYPVKSMQGEELNAADVSERGLLGDRAYALVDAPDGKVVSAKNPRKWGTLFDFRAALAEPPRAGAAVPAARITLPDGTLLTSEQKDLNQLLTRVLGREVALSAAAPPAPRLEEYWPDSEGLTRQDTVTEEALPAGTFFDLAVLHVLTTAPIDRLRELYPPGRFEARRFRPNLVVQAPSGEKGFVENGWVGRTLAVGDQVRLRITGPCTRCVMTSLAQGDLPRDLGVLRTAAEHNQANVGVYAAVTHGGLVRRGDSVRLE